MKAVRNYIYAINGWDAEQMAQAFCEDGIFDDKAYELLTGQVGYFVGRDAIKAMFAGLFENKPHGLISGYLIGVCGRYICSFVSGYIFFGAYAPEGWNPLIYSMVYQFFYIGIEAIITVAVLMIPSVKNTLAKLRESFC